MYDGRTAHIWTKCRRCRQLYTFMQPCDCRLYLRPLRAQVWRSRGWDATTWTVGGILITSALATLLLWLLGII